MRIIIKSILKSILNKKFRALLILISIIVSAGLFFASISISGTLTDNYREKLKQTAGSSDLVIEVRQNQSKPFLDPVNIKSLQDNFSYTTEEIQTEGFFQGSNAKKEKSSWLNLHGAPIKDINKTNPFNLADSMRGEFKEKKVIISKKMASENHLKIGDLLPLEIAGQVHHLKIYGIAEASGIFLNEEKSMSAIIPRETLSHMIGADSKVNVIHIKLKPHVSKEKMISKLQPLYKNASVKETISESDVSNQVGVLPVVLSIMVVVVSFMTIFIIYTCFKVVALERMSLIGTVRSIGLSRKKANFLLLSESLIYGIIGGGAGVALGIGFLYSITHIASSGTFKVSMHIQIAQVLTAILFAVLLCIGSSFIPILKISNIPIKAIILKQTEHNKTNHAVKFIVGVIFIVMSFIISGLTDGKSAVIAVGLSTVLCGVSLLFIVPVMTRVIALLFEKMFSFFSMNILALAAKNLRENKSVLNSISLLTIGITCLIFIQSASTSIMTATSNIYSTTADFDLQMQAAGSNQSIMKKTRAVESVDDVFGNYQLLNVEVKNKGAIQTVDSADQKHYLDYWKMNISKKLLYEKLHEQRNILLGTASMEKLGVKQGDMITLVFPQGEYKYKVIGSFDTLYSTGDFALISQKYMKRDGGFSTYSNFYVKANHNASQIEKDIQKELRKNKPSISTIKDIKDGYMKSNENMFLILKAFALFSMVIGIIGVINNSIISYFERKRWIAIMRSIGLEKNQLRLMFAAESLTMGIIGGIMGGLGGYLFVCILPFIYKAIYVPPVFIQYPIEQTIYYLLGAVCITVVSSISPILKSKHSSIIASLKND
ncbi:ABC transporter permease [Bacillus atrophaeus]|uniref:ABC transporter permease n=2 Tax=Bacillus atrophaeus TaxID=1452 RepID=UPI00216339F8|nr:FtsX-like permease family protein [Bacillus atrophaeus]